MTESDTHKNAEPMDTDLNYEIPKDPEIDGLLDQAAILNAEINEKRPLRPDVWETIQKKLKIDWTYDSNAIEGSTLTRGETAFFLEEGLTVEGKPFKDFLDARNHADAIDWLYEIIKGDRPISEGLIKEINALLLAGHKQTPAINHLGQKVKKLATPGQYKKQPNHVLQPDGTIHYYTEPLHVPDEMDRLCQWINQNLNTTHPILTSALAHYNMVRIHPFDDGNGRGARMLMNIILIKKGYPPAVIKNKKRRAYLEFLGRADQGDLDPFTRFVAGSLVDTQKGILGDMKTTSRQK